MESRREEENLVGTGKRRVHEMVYVFMKGLSCVKCYHKCYMNKNRYKNTCQIMMMIVGMINLFLLKIIGFNVQEKLCYSSTSMKRGQQSDAKL